jgi:hypothetical protein
MTARPNGRGSIRRNEGGIGRPDVLYDRNRGASQMTLFAKIFTTKTLLQIVFILAVTVMMKAMSAHYDFSWATALVQG